MLPLLEQPLHLRNFFKGVFVKVTNWLPFTLAALRWGWYKAERKLIYCRYFSENKCYLSGFMVKHQRIWTIFVTDFNFHALIPNHSTSPLWKGYREHGIGLNVLITSRTRFRVNPHSVVAWMSRNSLLKTGAKLKFKWLQLDSNPQPLSS